MTTKTTTATFKAAYVEYKDTKLTYGIDDNFGPFLVSEFIDDDGFPNRDNLSVNLKVYGLRPHDGSVFIDENNYSGLTQALVDAGLVEVTGTVHYGPFWTLANEVRILF